MEELCRYFSNFLKSVIRGIIGVIVIMGLLFLAWLVAQELGDWKEHLENTRYKD